MAFDSDKEAQAWLLHQAGYLDQQGYERAVEEIHAPKPPKQSPVAKTSASAPRSAPVASGRARAARKVPKRQQRGLAGFLAGAQAGRSKPVRRRR